MKLLLTSAGISNASIHNALVELLSKPVSESRALFIPTAIYSFPIGADIVYQVIRGSLGDPFCEMGWKSLGVLELTALPSIRKAQWIQLLQETDALLVGGGDCQYLCYWMQQSGLAKLLPSLLHRTVYVGLSAGSMVMTRFGTTYGGHTLPTESDKALGLIDIALHPHLDHKQFPENSQANLEKLAATISVPSYLIDDQTSINKYAAFGSNHQHSAIPPIGFSSVTTRPIPGDHFVVIRERGRHGVIKLPIVFELIATT